MQLPFATFALTKGNAAVWGCVFMNIYPANELVLQVLVGFGRSKWSSLMEQASCQLSPGGLCTLKWFSYCKAELVCVFCKEKTNRLNIWVVLHLCCKTDFCTPALQGLVGRNRDVVGVQRGMWAPDFTWVISRAAIESRKLCCTCLVDTSLLFFLFHRGSNTLGKSYCCTGLCLSNLRPCPYPERWWDVLSFSGWWPPSVPAVILLNSPTLYT